jgi:FkbM family methyltransferase
MVLREFLVRSVPQLGTLKRFAVAAGHSLRARETYSQHGEDVRSMDLLAEFDLDGGIYIDVGANHPTDISNTYLFYRAGHHGITVEPFPELARLLKLFRPRDNVLAVACGDEAGVAELAVSKTPVLSSLHRAQAGQVWKSFWVPVLPLDRIVIDLGVPWVFLLSVDVEGHAAAALRGATATLERTLLVCVEAPEGTEEAREVTELLARANFSIVERRGCNLFAMNQNRDRFKKR